MTLQSVVIILAGLVTVATAIGISYAVSKSAATTKAIDIYRETNAALEQRLTLAKTDLEEAQRRILKLEETVNVLKDTVTGAAIVKELGLDIAREESERKKEHREARKVLDHVEALLLQLVRGMKTT